MPCMELLGKEDELVEFRALKAIGKCPYPLRRIEAYDPGAEKVLVFLPNQLELGATTIASAHKGHCRTEIFFFKILSRISRSKPFQRPAVKIQIWKGLIAIVILRFLHFGSQFHWFLLNLVALLQKNLFSHRDLWTWLNQLYDVLPVFYEFEQLKVHFA